MKRREISLIFIHGRLGLESVMVVATRIIRGYTTRQDIVCSCEVSVDSALFFLLFFIFPSFAGVILLVIIRCMFLNHK